MKRYLKWTGVVAGGLVALVLLALGGVYLYTNHRMDVSYDITPASVAVPHDSASIARGWHIAVTRGCTDCHGGSPFSRGVSALMGLNLFLATGGRAYPLESVRAWLADAGFDNMKRKNLRQPGFELVTARKA